MTSGTASFGQKSDVDQGGTLLRSFMRTLPQPVLIITTSVDSTHYGLTLSSGTSASMDPPLLLICVDKKAPSREPIIKRGAFVANLLSEEQIGISDLFAGRFRDKEKFAGTKFHLTEDSALPVIDDALGYLECSVWKVHDGGDHDVILGRVVGGEVRSGAPIVYYDQSYGRLGKWEGAASLYPPY
jgi:flavin reductase (DIM6/NTAB) family NADH-FMN oxidoreductase RutF